MYMISCINGAMFNTVSWFRKRKIHLLDNSKALIIMYFCNTWNKEKYYIVNT